ncbi:MAG TPA: putative nucleotidyltransferase substrate binding domain-containing protein, partial [Burkholderiales bacterium]|nr:putative nucleotidyltransferase substrate binding domain-containing protein [Burkholderiales bacterium]
TTHTPRFLRQLAEDAVSTRPPLGLLADFITHDEPAAQGTIDLKRSGARLFVDAARVMALATGVAHTSTVQRLREAGSRLNMRAQEVSAACDAFLFIQTLRLRTPIDVAAPGKGRNRVAPDTLNEVDRRMLKESLRQARRLQSRLRLDYQL